MKAGWLSSLGLVLAVWAGAAEAADEVVWRAAAPQPTAERRDSPVTIGQPVPVATGQSVTPVAWSGADANRGLVVRAQSDGLPPPVPPPGVGGAPAPYAPPSGQPYVPPSPPPYVPPGGPPVPPPPGIPYNPGDPYNNGVVPDTMPPPGTTWWDKTKNIFDMQSGPFCGCGGRRPFESDHCFDGFISPVTDPFLFEDPRSLTQVRPIFLYQTIPSKNPGFKGGNIEFFGIEASVALTERWSVILSKLGGIWINPSGSALPPYNGDRSGFAEVNIGPQWTFIRNEHSGTLGALGLIFEIPTGSKSTFQDTGSLSLVPYLTFGQNFFRSSYGSFNGIGQIGYSFATDSKRSDFFKANLHLDYDIGNLHKFYPLIELDWRYYTKNGNTIHQNFEGGDLINFGATDITDRNNLLLAAGLRYQFNRNFQLGTAIEFPVVGTKDIENFRWTIDFIIRY
jgi:hypothetical protein